MSGKPSIEVAPTWNGKQARIIFLAVETYGSSTARDPKLSVAAMGCFGFRLNARNTAMINMPINGR